MDEKSKKGFGNLFLQDTHFLKVTIDSQDFLQIQKKCII